MTLPPHSLRDEIIALIEYVDFYRSERWEKCADELLEIIDREKKAAVEEAFRHSALSFVAEIPDYPYAEGFNKAVWQQKKLQSDVLSDMFPPPPNN